MGGGVKQLMSVFTIVLLVLVGVVFISGPAGILANLTPATLDFKFWVWIIFGYYILATLLPIDKIIGKIYPLFGFALLFMAVSLIIALIIKGFSIPELIPENWQNFHYDKVRFPIFPMLFITIACGAISGFHATQSPLMARCIKNESEGRKVFYGAMVIEGVVALIWAAISMSFFGGIQELGEVMIAQKGNAAWVVNEITKSLLGRMGAKLAILGVVAAPITSGDTAFRSARLTVGDLFEIQSETNQEQADYYCSALCCRFCADNHQFRCSLALLCLVQSDPGNGCPLDHNGLSLPEREGFLDNPAPGLIHDGSGYHLHHACSGGACPFKKHCIQYGYHCDVSFIAFISVLYQQRIKGQVSQQCQRW